jgi:3-oxoacyl-[acyl-carrier protein] reductase
LRVARRVIAGPIHSEEASMDLGIAGKVALVTGGARNLGRADALKLAEEGCRVAIVDLNKDGAEETAGEIRRRGGQALAVECDIADRPAVKAAIERIARELGPVDIAVNNASIIWTLAQLKDMKDEDWDLNINVNLNGTYNVTKAVIPGMRERRWGRVICMASIAGLLGGFGQTAYSTSKMGVIGFAKSVALEGARYNVTSNVIAPGIVGPNANMSPLYERMVKRVAMQREGQPEDIASAIAFLCSERARYITGAVLTITGGMDLFTF